MESLWGEGPEVPGILGGLVTGLWVSFLGMEEVRELDWISDEEDWSVVADHIVVSLLGVELDGKSSWISLAVVSTTLASNGGEAEEAWSSLTNSIKEVCSRKPMNFKFGKG